MRGIKKTLVTATFLDHHATDGENMKPVQCEVVGYLVKEDKDAIYVSPWICDGEVDNHNTEIYAIVRQPSLKIRKIKL